MSQRPTPAQDLGGAWQPDTPVNATTDGSQRTPNVATDADGNIYYVWQSIQNETAHIFVAALGDATTFPQRTFPRDIPVNDRARAVSPANPRIAAGATGQLAVIWEDERTGSKDIYAATSTDGGETWSTDVRVNDDDPTGGMPTNQEQPVIAAGSNGTLYALWTDGRNGNDDIYAAFSTDGGETWSANVRVNDDQTDAPQRAPVLAIGSNDQLYAAWIDTRSDAPHIYAATSDSGGQQWSANVQVNDNFLLQQDQPLLSAPTIAVSPQGAVYVAWQNSLNGIQIDRSTDGGQTWGSDSRVDDNEPDTVVATPALAVDVNTGEVFCVWCALEEAGANIRASSSTDGGRTWSASTVLNSVDGSAAPTPPAIAAAPAGYLYAVWGDDRDTLEDVYTAQRSPAPVNGSIPRIYLPLLRQ
jgi:Neuraminidase (sialidase)